MRHLNKLVALASLITIPAFAVNEDIKNDWLEGQEEQLMAYALEAVSDSTHQAEYKENLEEIRSSINEAFKEVEEGYESLTKVIAVTEKASLKMFALLLEENKKKLGVGLACATAALLLDQYGNSGRGSHALLAPLKNFAHQYASKVKGLGGIPSALLSFLKLHKEEKPLVVLETQDPQASENRFIILGPEYYAAFPYEKPQENLNQNQPKPAEPIEEQPSNELQTEQTQQEETNAQEPANTEEPQVEQQTVQESTEEQPQEESLSEEQPAEEQATQEDVSQEEPSQTEPTTPEEPVNP